MYESIDPINQNLLNYASPLTVVADYALVDIPNIALEVQKRNYPVFLDFS